MTSHGFLLECNISPSHAVTPTPIDASAVTAAVYLHIENSIEMIIYLNSNVSSIDRMNDL